MHHVELVFTLDLAGIAYDALQNPQLAVDGDIFPYNPIRSMVSASRMTVLPFILSTN